MGLPIRSRQVATLRRNATSFEQSTMLPSTELKIWKVKGDKWDLSCGLANEEEAFGELKMELDKLSDKRRISRKNCQVNEEKSL